MSKFPFDLTAEDFNEAYFELAAGIKQYYVSKMGKHNDLDKNFVKKPYAIPECFCDVIDKFFNDVTKKQYIAISHISQNDFNIFNKLTKNTDVQLVHKPFGKIYFLPKFKDTPLLKGCIYGLNCLNCRELYVGETMFDADTRIVQHRNALGRKDAKHSAIAEHWYKTGHSRFNFENPSLFGKESDPNIRKVIEAYEFRKNNATMNRIEEKGTFDPAWFRINSWPK